MSNTYLSPTQESGRAFIKRGIEGSVVMLNLLRFKKVADYSGAPELAPDSPITGEAAFQLYIDQTIPYLENSGGTILFLGKGADFLIGPSDERWNLVMLIRQKSVADFLAFASNEEYLRVIGHRTAALEDSRLLPLVEQKRQVR